MDEYDDEYDDYERQPDHTPEEIALAHEKVEAILREAVHISTGRTDFAPRAGQIRLARNITASAMKGEVGDPNVAEAPTGLGKSFAGLAPAAYMSSLIGEHKRRTVIATESIALQSQYVDKDAPTIIEATQRVVGHTPKIVLLKGWSNYVCLASTINAAEQVLGLAPGTGEDSPAKLIEGLESFSGWVVPPIDGAMFQKDEIVPLLIWALKQGVEGGSGDKTKYPGVLSDEAWRLISVPPAECAGTKCPLADICLPRKAKEDAQDADIIVTNHSMLAVQAATGAKVILGNSKLEGDEFPFPLSIVLVDEAHALPNIVRNQGRGEVSATRINSLVRAMNKLVTPELSREWAKEAEGIGELVSKLLDNITKGVRDGDVIRLKPSDQPLYPIEDKIMLWVSQGQSIADNAKNSPRTDIQIAYRRVSSAFDSFCDAWDAVNQHRSGVARWIEPPSQLDIQRGRKAVSVAKSAPVDVSGMLKFNVWENHTVNPDTGEDEVFKRTVVNMSATLPSGFGFQVGLKAQKIAYDSPFEVAYEHSGLFIPMFTKSDEYMEHWSTYNDVTRTIQHFDEFDPSILGKPGYQGKWQFDTRKHTNWAIAQMLPLVERNGGRSLVLSATVSAGKRYVEALRHHAAGRWRVLSQWEGESLRNLVTQWKEDETSVLVGTKSLMTGVDAPGQTNSLVIVDRPARAAGNPVDDARVELVMDRMDYSKWEADRLVYVSDASLLLEQAAGRGIRQVDDVVLICVLDPRMLKRGTFTYPAPTQKSYMRGLAKFGEKMTHVEDAFGYIDNLRARFPSEPKPAPAETKGIDFSKLLAETEL